MKSKKIYIGIAAITVSLIIVIASIFYIKTNQKDVELSKFDQNANENTKEAMNETSETTDEKGAEESTEENTEESTEEVEEPSEPVVVSASGTKYVNISSLNVRSGPDTSYSRLGTLGFADEVEITGKSDNWYRISYNEDIGFVSGDYLVDEKPEYEHVEHVIIINSRNNTLRYYRSGSLVASYSCATGKSSTPTPQGRFSIFEKLVNRPYGKTPDIPGDSPNNALGRRWMQFKSGGYAIHGTNAPGSIGSHASHGCVRMHNSDVIELYSMVPYGTTVIIKNTSASDQSIAASYGVYLE